LTTIKYFRKEYDEHVREHKCTAGVCKSLIAYYIDPQKCQACMICARKCPVDAIEGGKNTIHVINQEICTKCGTCFAECPSRFSAVKVISGEPVPSPLPELERVVTRAKGKKE